MKYPVLSLRIVEPAVMNEALLIAYLKSECSPGEKEKVKNWIRESEEHRNLFEEIKTIWEFSRMDNSDPQTGTEASWTRISKAINEAPPHIRSARHPSIGKYLRMAASIALLLGLGFLALRYSGREGSLPERAVVQTQAEKEQVELPDGSKVWLNAHSMLSFPSSFSRKERRVSLKGEAYFQVKKDKRRTCTVEIGNSRVEVLGTSFNILSPGEGKEQIVTVETGKVSFHPLGDPSGGVLLTAGERGVFSSREMVYRKSVNADPNYLAWKTGMLIFREASLEEVCRVISIHYKQDISLSDPVDKTRKLTATWNNKELEEVLQILTMTLDLSYRTEGEKIIIH